MSNTVRFHQLLKEIGDLHDRKARDYGSEEDPFANIRASEEWGVPGWAGALMRANDKMHRLQRYVAKGELANESAMDSMMDIAVYALIAYILYGEQSESERQEDTSTSTMESARAAESFATPPITPALQHSEACRKKQKSLDNAWDYAPCWNRECVNFVEIMT